MLPLFLNLDKKYSSSSDVHPFNSQSYMLKIVFFLKVFIINRKKSTLAF